MVHMNIHIYSTHTRVRARTQVHINRHYTQGTAIWEQNLLPPTKLSNPPQRHPNEWSTLFRWSV